MSESASRETIPGKASRTALPALVSDEDGDDSGKFVPKIRLNGDKHSEPNNKITTVNFEFGDSKRKCF